MLLLCSGVLLLLLYSVAGKWQVIPQSLHIVQLSHFKTHIQNICTPARHHALWVGVGGTHWLVCWVQVVGENIVCNALISLIQNLLFALRACLL